MFGILNLISHVLIFSIYWPGNQLSPPPLFLNGLTKKSNKTPLIFNYLLKLDENSGPFTNHNLKTVLTDHELIRTSKKLSNSF
ncbi:protein of unknown function [Vibrio tapetis subsp. tapetis]|uniref:Uncharacterized protein n=1 Tax=Vibrio tapetis subsp. tapetis TaxID=1671868 RepID=A0A2N8ZI99_9VIBR|nr:protein of unknown function [Vibrio tapetis subsp. tapetis]